MQPNSQLHGHAVPATHLLSVWAYGALQGEGRIAGPQGVIFMGKRGAEQGHNAVAKHLVDGALKAVDGAHHELDGGVQELLRRLGIESLDEPGGVLDVGKEHGDLLALACEAGTYAENLFG